ncbi:MAG: FkbM family methyltransferase [Calditrichota bacterium]
MELKPLARRVKTLLQIATGSEPLIRADVRISKERFGSTYGGWEISTEAISEGSIVYSIGVGQDVSFDLALIERFGLAIFAFDPTPKSLHWVEQQSLPDLFKIHSYGIADFDGTVSFNPPENPDHVSHTLLERPETAAESITVPVKKLSTIMQELGHSHIDILKMDIEGAEYAVIQDICSSDIRPKQILVEFHHRFETVSVDKTLEAIAVLRNNAYKLFSVSSTNEEFSFIHQSALTNV